MVNRWMPTDFARLVLDANIMVSALLGKSLPLLVGLFEAGVRLLAPVHQIAETRHVLGQRQKLSGADVDALLAPLLDIVEPVNPALFDKYEAKARSRLGTRGQPDWPVLAAAYAMKASVWSHDKDFFGSGAPVWRTEILRHELSMLAATPV